MRMWGSEWEAAISEARTALALNPNSAFVISMLGCVLGFGGYHDEALDRLRQAMRASPHDPLTWLWTRWRGVIQFYSRKFDAALETFSELVRLRPEYGPNHGYIAGSLAFLGRLDEARAVLERAGLRLPRPALAAKTALVAAGRLCLAERGPAAGGGRNPKRRPVASPRSSPMCEGPLSARGFGGDADLRLQQTTLNGCSRALSPGKRRGK